MRIFIATLIVSLVALILGPAADTSTSHTGAAAYAALDLEPRPPRVSRSAPRTAPPVPKPKQSPKPKPTKTRKPAPAPVPKTAVKAFAASLVGTEQFKCLDALWNRESGWRPTASNPSGAYGIPQALPGNKMAVIASDWRTNPYTQVKWGVRYIKSRYGTSCGAWHHFQQHGWY